jgi:uncharacterized protein (DUF1684 family)
MRLRVFFLAVLPLLAADPLTEKVTAWRTKYEAGLKSETGWLSVAGLYWLEQGANVAGTAASNKVVLPAGPAVAGTFERVGDRVKWKPANGSARTLQSDKDGAKPDLLTIDRLTLFVIDRNGKIGIRMRDPQSKMRREFHGTKWFPIRAQYSLTGEFKPYPQKKVVMVPDVTGNTLRYESPGEVEFAVNGQKVRLEPVLDEGQLFFVFRDKTSGKQTYGGGRMLYAPLPGPDNKVDLEMNIAKNPPCVFTPYATCPLPTKRNTLNVAIEAGELAQPGH